MLLSVLKQGFHELGNFEDSPGWMSTRKVKLGICIELTLQLFHFLENERDSAMKSGWNIVAEQHGHLFQGPVVARQGSLNAMFQHLTDAVMFFALK